MDHKFFIGHVSSSFCVYLTTNKQVLFWAEFFAREVPHGQADGAREASVFIYRRDIGARYGTHLVAAERICHRLG
jgi:hypothetical protein